jgi:hypothetical protein
MFLSKDDEKITKIISVIFYHIAFYIIFYFGFFNRINYKDKQVSNLVK